jgi:hypothetical protein
MLSSNFDKQSFQDFVNSSDSTKLRAGGVSATTPERYVVDVSRDSRDVFIFVFLEMYATMELQQRVLVKYDDGSAQIVGLRIGPS